MNNLNKLWGMKAYLCGPMDRAKDGGIDWRRNITPFLQNLGVVILDPTDKPIDIGLEDIENRQYRKELKQAGNYDALSEQIRTLRVVDLRMIDISDFIIVYLNNDIVSCGTYEELFWANRMKKPILIMCEQGKNECPDWLFGVLPHQHIMSTWEDLYKYLDKVNQGLDTNCYKRWMFFDYNRLTPPCIVKE
jgi:nucleoside 2-deoxyribosyltransferase